jgi:hypothetical protein
MAAVTSCANALLSLVFVYVTLFKAHRDALYHSYIAKVTFFPEARVLGVTRLGDLYTCIPMLLHSLNSCAVRMGQLRSLVLLSP